MAAVIVVQNYGVMLLGGLLAFSLTGCVNMQFVVFWGLYPNESYRIKSLVFAIWLLDLCHSALVATSLWDSIIRPYGDFDMIDRIPWSVGATVELTAMITFLVQSFFAYRIYKFHAKKLTMVVPIFAFAFCRLIAASVSTVEMIRLKSYAAFVLPFPGRIFTLGLALLALVDIMITTSLCYFLRKNRIKVTKLSHGLDACVHLTSDSVHLIDTLILWTVQNGSITCAATTASLVCWLCMPQNRIFLGIHFIVAKLYANSLLVTLNARKGMRNGKQNSAENHPLPIVNFGDSPTSRTLRPPPAFLTRHNTCQLDPKRGKSLRVNVEHVVNTNLRDDIIELEVRTDRKLQGRR